MELGVVSFFHAHIGSALRSLSPSLEAKQTSNSSSTTQMAWFWFTLFCVAAASSFSPSTMRGVCECL